MHGEIFSQEDKERIVEHVCNEIAVNKRNLFSILRDDQRMCSYATFKRWQRESETISTLVAHAREDALEAIIEEIIEISDANEGDVYIEYRDDGTPYAKVDGDVIQRAKLRVYARERVAALMVPRRFGQKLDVTSDGKALPGPAPNRLDRIEALLTLAAQRKAQPDAPTMIDVTPEPDIDDVMS